MRSLLLVVAATAIVGSYINPLGPRSGDPGAAYDDVSGMYYFAVTSANAPDAFPVYMSADLGSWKLVSHVFAGWKAGAGQPQWATKDMWAPEFHKLKSGKWAVYFAARNRAGTLCVGVAVSTTSSILGPYADAGRELIVSANVSIGNIDPTFHVDDDGTSYLIYKEDGNAIEEPTPLWAVTLADNGTAVTSQNRTMLITNDPSTWEKSLVEAPWVVKHAGEYFLFYSGAWQAGYSVGVARAPSILGPYVKAGPPLLHTNTSSRPFQGTGHCSVITDPATGGLAMLYHSWMNGTEFVMMDRVTWNASGWPVVGDGTTYPSSTEQPIP